MTMWYFKVLHKAIIVCCFKYGFIEAKLKKEILMRWMVLLLINLLPIKMVQIPKFWMCELTHANWKASLILM